MGANKVRVPVRRGRLYFKNRKKLSTALEQKGLKFSSSVSSGRATSELSQLPPDSLYAMGPFIGGGLPDDIFLYHEC